MNARAWTLIVASTLTLACGGRVGDSDAGETDSAGTDASESGEASDVGTSGGVDTAEPSDSGETGEDAVAACIVDGALTRALAIADSKGQQLHVYEVGAAPITLDASLPDGVDAPAILGTDANAAVLAISSSYSKYIGPGSIEGAVLRLYERGGGALLWSRAFADYRLAQIHVDALGRVAATVGWSVAPTPAGVLVIDGVVTELPNFGPAGPIGPSGWVPGYIYDDLQEQLGTGLYNVETDALVQVTAGNNPSGWRVDGETIEYIDNDAEVPRLVVAGPASASAIELTPFAGLAPVYTDGVAGDYRLLVANLDGQGDAVTRKLARLERSTGALTPIDPTPPPGLEAFDCYFPRNAIDSDGRVLFELRDAGAARVYAWDPDDETWTALGEPMTEVEDIQVAGGFGRVLELHGHGANTTYCVGTEWSDPPPDALVGSSIQLARVDPPLQLVIDAEGFGAVSVDPDERCAAWISGGGAHQTVHDLDDDDALELPVAGAVVWLD